MKVTLNRRLGQHQAGDTVDYDDGSARRLLERGLATPTRDHAAPSQPPKPAITQLEVPPQSGKGSGRDAWAAYAAQHDMTVADDDGRDEIIDACRAADVPVE